MRGLNIINRSLRPGCLLNAFAPIARYEGDGNRLVGMRWLAFSVSTPKRLRSCRHRALRDVEDLSEVRHAARVEASRMPDCTGDHP